MSSKKTIAALTAFFFAGSVAAADLVIYVYLVNAQGMGKEAGTITAADSPYGLLLTPKLTGLPPGLHGFHMHQNPSMSPGKDGDKTVPALAAGGHFDPKATGKHEGPYGAGHLGDLPALYVAPDSSASTPVLAPRLKVADLKGHSLMIHEGGDNYSDLPVKLGGGGARMACGVVE